MNRPLHLTKQRKVILDIVKAAQDHPTASDLMERLREHGHHFAYGTVYNSLNFLASHGLVQELQLGDGSARYDGRMEPHQHIVCRKCGKVDEVAIEYPQDWVDMIRHQTDYLVEGFNLVCEGLCRQCQLDAKK